jgi:hypothetical protein
VLQDPRAGDAAIGRALSFTHALETAQRRAAKVPVLPAELRTALDRIEAEVEHRRMVAALW